jgi:diphthamide synthase subunit DPH2
MTKMKTSLISRTPMIHRILTAVRIGIVGGTAARAVRTSTAKRLSRSRANRAQGSELVNDVDEEVFLAL